MHGETRDRRPGRIADNDGVQPKPRTRRRPRILPPHSQKSRLHRVFHYRAVRPLRGGEERLAVDGAEDVVVANIPVLRTGEEVRHAEGCCE